MPITDWPREDRPREKLLNKGEQALTDAELIAIILKSGTRGKTALDIAKELLSEFGNLKKLLRAPPRSLMKKQGIGSAKYASLRATIELGKRYLNERLPTGAVLNNTRVTQRFLADRLRDFTNEVFACLFLDNHLKLISYNELFYGTINEANVYPREIVRRALEHNAAKIILAHNHPSGRPTPSAADREVTLLIKNALGLVDIEVIDHIIIGNPENFSFAEAGIL
ncbi:MAG: DNA repair protein RadC [Gammaproteobacteria bacterium]|nr:DNA repair protein RadC [Gammaproteobacteria bacterium]MCW5582351.1 DNA repair protein RadC [Gammaproteobacteria bacterium]